MSTSIKISLKTKTVTTISQPKKAQKQKLNDDEEKEGESADKNDTEYVEDEIEFDAKDDELSDADFGETSEHSNYDRELDDLKENNEDSNEGEYNVLIHRENLDSNDDEEVEESTDILETSDFLTTKDSCNENPNFAVIVDFMEKFSEHLGLKKIPMRELQKMVCDPNVDIHMDLIQLHMDLLKKIKLSKNNSKKIYITKRSWENALVLFCNGPGSMVDVGTEIQNSGYSRVSLNIRLDILKHLMESQFEWNEPLRFLVDDLPVEVLRNEPTGRDIHGKTYWTQARLF